MDERLMAVYQVGKTYDGGEISKAKPPAQERARMILLPDGNNK